MEFRQKAKEKNVFMGSVILIQIEDIYLFQDDSKNFGIEENKFMYIYLRKYFSLELLILYRIFSF